ncbi:MAG TPA: ATP-binding protein [Steroidobacteraceae bacterium]|jgi:signal transduction histidine kinase/ActR/RegA family two-component response regulator
MTSIRDDQPGSPCDELTHPDLLARSDLLEIALAAGRLGYCLLDVGRRVLRASTAFKSEFGWAPDAPIDLEALEEHIHLEDREKFLDALNAAIEKGSDIDVVVRVSWDPEIDQSVALRGRVVRYGSADRSGDRIVVTSRNVTAEVLTSHARDEFLYTVSHEMRSPLNAILGWNRILTLKRADDAEVAAIAPRIEQSARAQLKIVNSLLDLGRISTGKLRIEPRPTRIAKVVGLALDEARAAAAAKRIEIVADLSLGDPLSGSTSGPQLRADPDRLQQVVSNLLSNAIKFTPPSGKVTVSLRELENAIELSVSDTGQGIAPERLPRVFDCSGLGLQLVREIVSLHQGTVSAHSDGVGRGATFTVHLPLPPHQRVADSSTSLRGLSILVVDDELDARTVVAEALRLEGAAVTVSDSVRAALGQLRASDAHFDIVVTDIGMPDEDGYSLVRKLRGMRNGHQTLAIAVTGYVSKSDVESAIDAGFDMHVPKPVDFDSFVPMMRRMARARVSA